MSDAERPTASRGEVLVGKPVFFAVVEDDVVRAELAAELRHRFGADYEVVAERAAEPAMAALERLAAGPNPVALLIAGQSLPRTGRGPSPPGTCRGPSPPGTGGVEFLVRAHELHPGAKRALLIGRGEWARGSAHPAVRAMTLGQIDSYLFHPWASPERWLYLPVSELLADWVTSRPPAYEAIRIVGSQWEARSHQLRDILSRAAIPYGLYPPDSDEGRRLLDEAGEDGTRLPVLAFHTGGVLVDPSHAELAEALGFRTRPEVAVEPYDVVIAGGGPAGLAAAVYGASEGLRTLLLEPRIPGGQAGTSSLIRNYLGFPRGLTGDDLTNRAMEQAWLFGTEMVLAQSATGLRVSGRDRLVRVSDGAEVAARAVIVATGVSWRRLGVPSLEALHGAGVFYGASAAEAKAMDGQEVFVVGAGNSAGQAVINLATHASDVTVVVRGEDLASSMSDYLVRQVESLPNVKVRLRSEVVDGRGRGRLEALTLRDNAAGTVEEVPAAALFVMIGAEPHTAWLGNLVACDRHGYVMTGLDLLQAGKPPANWPLERPPMLLETAVPGVFAAGDVRHRSVKRVAAAVGSGAIALQLVHEYLGG
jgi:thioredoxin reductase (NADPH)